MARAPKPIASLARMIEEASNAIYALDAGGRITYLNGACESWIARPAADVVGTVCKYDGDQGNAASDVVAGLAPPPEVFNHWSGRAVASPADPSSRRAVSFVPLADHEGACLGVLAIVGREPAEESAPAGAFHDPTPQEMHDRLRLWRDLLRKQHAMTLVVGDSPAARLLRDQVQAASSSPTPLLVAGRAGSGRQHLARGIHLARTESAAGAFVPLACPTLGGELLLSTVDAFIAARHGAPPGTMLLRDVDSLSLDLQGSLAKKLATRDLRRSVMATSNRPLLALAAEGRFHRELAMILSAITIEVPPLSERREDLPLLAQAILESVNREQSRQLSGFTQEALDIIANYPWPGEMAELVHIVRMAHVASEGPFVPAANLPRTLREMLLADRHPPRDPSPIQLEELLSRLERDLITRALRLARNNKSKAAKLLGMTRPKLYRRLEQLGMVE